MTSKFLAVSLLVSITLLAIGCDPVAPVDELPIEEPRVEPKNPDSVKKLVEMGASAPTLSEEGYVTGIVFVPGSGVMDGDLAFLKEFEQLEDLSLMRAEITDSGLIFLAECDNLKGLALSGTKITGSGLGHLVGLTNLERLHLDETKVDDEGIRYLASLDKLTHLSLNDTQMTDEGLRHIAGLTDLRELKLGGNIGITDASQGILQRFTKLKWLELSDTGITQQAADAIQEVLPGDAVRYVSPDTSTFE